MIYRFACRREILDYKAKNRLTFAQISAQFGIGTATLIRWKKQLIPRKLVKKLDNKKLLADVERFPEDYHRERALRLGVAERTIGTALKKLGVRYEKTPAASRGRRRGRYRLPENAAASIKPI